MASGCLGPVYTKHQCQHCDDACDSVLIAKSGVTPEWGCNLFSSNSIVFNENRIASVIAALMLTLGIKGRLQTPRLVEWQVGSWGLFHKGNE